MKKIKINGNFEIEVEECKGIRKISGLMFTSRRKAKALLFNFKKPTRLAIHSFYVFYPFLAIWLDDKNRMVEKRIVNPFNPFVIPKKSYSKLVEIPLNEKYDKIVKTLVAKK